MADPGVVTSAAHGYTTGDLITIQAVVGMTEVNGNQYTVTVIDVDTFSIVNTTAFTPYTSGGLAFKKGDMPGSVSFYESRLVYGGTGKNPERFWLTRGPDDDGAPRYDDITIGNEDDDAVAFTLAPTTGKVDAIEWIAGNTKFLIFGTFGGTSKVTGGADDEPITPSSIQVKTIDAFGCADITPVPQGSILIYIQRGKLITRSFEYDLLSEAYSSVDRNLVSDSLTVGGLNQIAFQSGRPDILWAVRADGTLLGLSFKMKEDVSGWHRHTLGGSGKVLSVGVMPRADNYDQLWVIVERTIDGATRRYVEFFEDEPVIPEFLDYYTGDANKAADTLVYGLAMFEAQKEYMHLDSALTYDGIDPGVTAGAAITPAAVSGASVAFTSDANMFLATDVGREIWKKSESGVGTGRATILTYVSATEVTCQITVDFDNVVAMAAGSWYFTTDSISGLEHLEDESVGILTDGGVHPVKTVTGGVVTLDAQAGKVHAGKKYVGLIKSLNLEGGGINGPAQSKPRNVAKLGIHFLNTLGARYGTNRYSLAAVNFRSALDSLDRPPPLFTGVKDITHFDAWQNEKHYFIEQQQPLPCVIQMVDIFMDTTNE